jgi:hypothetical protein
MTAKDQNELFHDSVIDAFRSAIAMMGGFEAVGIDIWPSKTRKAAGALLSDILNVDRNNKFSIDELMHFLRIARDRGVHLPMHFLCDEVGYNRTQPVDAADQEAEVARQMDAAARRFDSAVKRLERIRNSDALKHIRTLK